MNRAHQKRQARHTRAKQARRDRFISAYIRRKNKEVYGEAEKFYLDLDEKYPNKRDLTITDEFTQQTTNYVSVAQARIDQKKKLVSQGVINLQIPLWNKADIEIAVMDQKADESLAIPESIYKDLLDEITKDPTLNAIFNGIEQHGEQPEDLNQIINESLSLEQELDNLMCE